MKVIDKTPDEGAPSVLDMHEQDAAHAVAADPDRYEVVASTAAAARAELRSRMTVEQRVAALEAAYDALVEDDEDPQDEAAYVESEPEPQPAEPKATA